MSWLSEGLGKLGHALGLGGPSTPKNAPTFASSGYTTAPPLPLGPTKPALPYQTQAPLPIPQTTSQFNAGDALGWLKDHSGDFIKWLGGRGIDIGKWLADHGGDIVSYAASHADDVAGFLKDHAGDIVDYGLGAANLVNAAQLGKKSTDYANKAEQAVTGSYNERAPLRLAGVQGMLNPSAGNAAALAGVNAVPLPQIAPRPLPLPLNDPRLAAVNRIAQQSPYIPPPIPLR